VILWWIYQEGTRELEGLSTMIQPVMLLTTTANDTTNVMMVCLSAGIAI
jgi:hypothetical protein